MVKLTISRLLPLAAGLALGFATSAAAQVPISGTTGTVALEGTVQQEHAVGDQVVVKTKDGVEHVFSAAKDLLVHGGKNAGPEALKSLREGTTVVVHYTKDGATESAHEVDRVGDDGLKTTEGTVTEINRKAKQIRVRFDNGKSETFQLTERAASDAGKDVETGLGDGKRVTIYYADEAGRKVAHLFRKVLSISE